MRGKENISHKNIVLTGAASGIGLAILKLLAAPKLDNTILAPDLDADKLEGFAPNVIPMTADITKEEDVDRIFERAEELFDQIDIFYNNAGGPYYERYDYVDWDRTEYIYKLNAIAPAYMYTKYLQHLRGRDGHLCYTVSCIGLMALPGYSLYTSTKFALRGFQQAIRLEKPKNLKITCLYPVGTETAFFGIDKSRAKIPYDRPFPMMKPKSVAKLMVRGMAKGQKNVYPAVWMATYPFFVAVPFAKKIYWWEEGFKFKRYIANAKAQGRQP